MKKMELILRVAALCAACVLLLSCGSGKQSSVVNSQPSDGRTGVPVRHCPAPPASFKVGDPPPFQAAEIRGAPSFQAATPSETTLDQALSEVEAMATPEGAPEGLVQMLAEMLAEKLASRPPLSPADEVNDLTISSSEGGSITLTWSYRHCGDYNQDGIVNIMDLTPLAVHFGESADEEGIWPYAIDEVIDGNEDGAITVGDVTPLAAGFGGEVMGYYVEESEELGGPFSVKTVTPLPAPEGEGRMVLAQTIEVGKCRFFRVSPVDSAGEEGRSSNLVHYGEQLEPLILGVSPQEGYAGEEVQFVAEVAGLAPFEYGWDFGHGADPNASSEESPVVVLRGAGEYAAHLMVWNDYGRADCDFTLTVEEAPPPPEPPEIVGIAPTVLTVGEPTKLAVVVTGTPPFYYYWGIDGLLENGFSTEFSPEVTAQEKQDYIGQVKVVNAAGSDSFYFTLKAGLPEDFPQIVDVQPREMPYETWSRLYPEVTGAEPLEYRWEFGKWWWPSSVSYEEEPTVMFSGGPYGDYPVVLQVSNEYGKDVFEFMVNMHAVEWWLGGIDTVASKIPQFDAKLIADRPMAAYLVGTGTSEPQEVKFASGPEGGSGSWRKCTVDFMEDLEAVALAEVSGKPMVAYCGQLPGAQPNEIRVAVGRNERPGQGDWDIYRVHEGYGSVDIWEVQGRPAIVYLAGDPEGPENVATLYYSMNTEADGSGIWQRVKVMQGSSGSADFVHKSLRVFDGRPAVVCSLHDEGVRRLYFAIADTSDGLGSWSSNLIIQYFLPVVGAPTGIQGSHSVAEVDGRPAVATYYIHKLLPTWDCEAEMKYLICDTADGMGEWRETTVYPRTANVGFDVATSLAVIDGKPVLVFGDFGTDYEPYRGALFCFTCDSADGLGKWERGSLVDPIGGGNPLLFHLADDTPYIVYKHPERLDPELLYQLVYAKWYEY